MFSLLFDEHEKKICERFLYSKTQYQIMKIIYTEHAEDRISERGIKKEWVENVLKKPDKRKKGKGDKRIAVKSINSEKISVVYAVEGGNFIVVTAYWGE